MKKYISWTLIVGFILGILFWGAFNWSLALTNSEEFCVSCHEMRDNPYAEYKDTIHSINKAGVKTTCSDCHVPKQWAYKMKRKIEAASEVYHKILGTIDTKEKYEQHRLKMAIRVWKTMKSTDSRECRGCHKFESMDLDEQDKSASRKHVKAQKEGQTCIDCHKGIAHEMPENGEAAAERLGL